MDVGIEVGMAAQGFGATEKEHTEILELHQDFAKVDKGRYKKGEGRKEWIRNGKYLPANISCKVSG